MDDLLGGQIGTAKTQYGWLHGSVTPQDVEFCPISSSIVSGSATRVKCRKKTGSFHSFRMTTVIKSFIV